MQHLSPSLPRGSAPWRSLEKLIYSGDLISSEQAGEWNRGAGRRRKTSFKNAVGSRGWLKPGGRAAFPCPWFSPPAAVGIPVAQRSAQLRG